MLDIPGLGDNDAAMAYRNAEGRRACNIVFHLVRLELKGQAPFIESLMDSTNNGSLKLVISKAAQLLGQATVANYLEDLLSETLGPTVMEKLKVYVVDSKPPEGRQDLLDSLERLQKAVISTARDDEQMRAENFVTRANATFCLFRGTLCSTAKESLSQFHEIKQLLDSLPQSVVSRF